MSQEALPADRLTIPSLFETLNHELRLRTLVSLYMADPDEYYWADDLVRFDEQRDEVLGQLLHNHFPKLEERGIIEWDHEYNRVTRGPMFHVVDRLLDCLVVCDDGFQTRLLDYEM